MQAKLIFLNVLSDGPDRSTRFYEELFGTQLFARSLTDQTDGYHMPISSDGIDLNITGSFAGQPPRIVPFFAVDDLRYVVDRLASEGGKAVSDEFAVGVPDSMLEQFRRKASERGRSGEKIGSKLGDAVLMLDPDGNPIGLMHLEPFVHEHFKWGKYYQPLTETQLLDQMVSLFIARGVFS